MNRNSMYFPHDLNSRNDDKLLKLRTKFGSAAGVGLFWMLVELMAESSSGYIDGSAEAELSLSLSVPKETLREFIDFATDEAISIFIKTKDGRITTKRMLKHISFRNERSKSGRSGGLRSGLVRNLKLSSASSSALAQIEQRKGKERKGNKRVESKPATPSNFIEELKNNAAYKGIEVDREALKAKLWAEKRGRKFTERFFLNWMNRADKTVTVAVVRKEAKPNATCEACGGTGKLSDGKKCWCYS